MNIKAIVKYALMKSSKRGNLNPKALITLLIAVAILGGVAVTIFQGVNATNLSNAPSWFVITAPIVVGAIIIMWLIKGMR